MPTKITYADLAEIELNRDVPVVARTIKVGPSDLTDPQVAASIVDLEADMPVALAARSIYAQINDITAAGAEVGGLPAYAGTISRIELVPSATIAVGDLVVSCSIGSTPIVGGTLTIPSGSLALDSFFVTPSADNVCAEGDVISWAVSGGNTAVGSAYLRFIMD